MNDEPGRPRALDPGTLPRPHGYAQALEVPPGRLVMVSGQVALDAANQVVGVGDVAAQTRQAFGNVALALAAAGLTFRDVVKLQVYLTDMAHLPVVREVRAGFIDPERPPAMTLVQVSGLILPELLIEVDAIAASPV